MLIYSNIIVSFLICDIAVTALNLYVTDYLTISFIMTFLLSLRHFIVWRSSNTITQTCRKLVMLRFHGNYIFLKILCIIFCTELYIICPNSLFLSTLFYDLYFFVSLSNVCNLYNFNQSYEICINTIDVFLPIYGSAYLDMN